MLNVCLGALSRLISVRFGVDQVYAACVFVCKGNDELRWQYRSIAEAWLCLLRSDLCCGNSARASCSTKQKCRSPCSKLISVVYHLSFARL